MKKLLPLVFILAALCVSIFAQKDKMTAEEVISKHLASIGTPEARAAAKSRVLIGQGMLSSKQGYNGQIAGPAQLASGNGKFLLAIIFNSNDYPYEKLAFDGKDQTFGRALGNNDAGSPANVTDTRSRRNVTLLGEFLKSQSSIMKQGLIGGVLSSSWPLLNPETKKVKFEYGGQENVNGKPLYKLKVRLSGAGDMRVNLYFEADTFHHVITEYQYSIQPHMISSDSTVNATAKASYFSMTEHFSDFKKVGDLVLPLGYKIAIANQYPESSEQLEWLMSFKQVYYNEALEDGVFKVS